MFRTSRTARRGCAALTWMGEWRLPGPGRRAARSERQMRRERDSTRPNDERQRWRRRPIAR